MTPETQREVEAELAKATPCTEVEYQHVVGGLRALLAENAAHEAELLDAEHRRQNVALDLNEACAARDAALAELACVKLDVAGCRYAEADPEQAFREGYCAGDGLPDDGDTYGLELNVAAWRERRAAERKA